MSARGGSSLLGRLEALLLLALGLGALVFAWGPRYTTLMNPAFRWVTLAGAVLVATLGVALLLTPRRVVNASALLLFSTLALMIVIGRPDVSQGGAIAPPNAPPARARDGYEELVLESLFQTLSEERVDVAEADYVVQGRLHRVTEGAGASREILLYPKVACCLADALAYAVRLEVAPGLLPPEGASWVYVYGRLRRLEAPLVTPPFRVGAIAFTAVSRRYVLEVHEIVDYRTLLEDVTQKIPAVQCAAFHDALRATGLAERLQGEETFTVFAPIDSEFLRQVRTLDTTGSGSVGAPRLKRYVGSFVGSREPVAPGPLRTRHPPNALRADPGDRRRRGAARRGRCAHPLRGPGGPERHRAHRPSRVGAGSTLTERSTQIPPLPPGRDRRSFAEMFRERQRGLSAAAGGA